MCIRDRLISLKKDSVFNALFVLSIITAIISLMPLMYGLNSDKNKNDLALVYSETQCQAAAVYTTNKVKGCLLYTSGSRE